MTVREIYELIDSFAPFSGKCEWDNCGLLVGSENDKVSKIGFSLDATAETIEEAAKNGCSLLVTHHPIIFRPLSALTPGDPAYIAAKLGVAVLSVHTPFDKSDPGVNTALAEKLGLVNVKRLCVEGDASMCMMGELDSPLSDSELSALCSKALNAAVTYSPYAGKIKKVAVCGGAGGEFYSDAKKYGADALVTGEAKHHEFLGAKSEGIALLAAGHYETEAPAVETLMELVKKGSEAECALINQSKPTKFTGAI